MRSHILAAVLAATIACTSPVHAQSATTMTYQGQLNEAGVLANGDYEFEFRLLDGNSSQIGTTDALTATVTHGTFSARALEISVRPALSGDAFTVLSPNASITAAPVAQFALAGNEGPQGPAGPQGPQGDPGDPQWLPLAPSGIRYIDGIVEIRSTNSDAAFDVRKNGRTGLFVNKLGGVSIGQRDNSVVPGNMYMTGRLGIGDSSPEASLDVNGSAIIVGQLTVGTSIGGGSFSINCSGDAGKSGGGLWSFFSDARLKKNITPMTGSLDTIAKLRPMNFEFANKDHFSYVPGIQRGLIAQDVQEVIPEWVKQADDGYLTLDMAGYEALIIGAIQELQAVKDAQIAQLQMQNDELKARLDRIEHMLLRMDIAD